MPLLLRVTVEADNQWRLLVGNLSERFHEARIDPDRLAAVRAALANWESLKPRIVPIRGNDRPFRQAEEDLGRALIRILGSSQQLTQSFASEYGAARAQGQPLVVLVDAEDPEVRRIPWELLAGDEAGLPLEAAHAGIVARLLPGRGRPAVLPENLGVNVAVWCPTPADPVCAEVLEALDLTLARSEAGPAYRIDPHAGTTPPPEIGSTVLHIVCHGQHDAEEVRLLVGQDSAGPPVAVARLAAWVATADVVVLDVCEAGATTQSLLDALPGRFIAAGARAVIAPTRRCGGRAAEAFTAGFYSSWARGGSLAMSAAAGRNEVAAMGLGVQDSRWYNHVLYVPDADAPSRAGPPPAFWRPEGWPRPRREAEQLLRVAKELSDRDGLGFVGVEHLALALAHGEGSGVLTTRIRLLLAGKVGQLEGHKKGLTAPGGRHPDSRGTPRLRAWAAPSRRTSRRTTCGPSSPWIAATCSTASWIRPCTGS